MSELSPAARAILDAGHIAQDPTALQRERNRAALRARLAAEASAPPPVTRRPPPRVAWWGAAFVGLAALVVALLWRRDPSPAPPVRVPVPARPAPVIAPVIAPAPVVVAPAPVAPTQEAPRPAPVVPAARERRTEPTEVDTMAEELRLLRESRRALDQGDGRAALALVQTHARRFPRGQLAEEREATRVLALCASGDAVAARRAGESFASRYPQSPQLPRVRRSCAFEPARP
jgi:hypothetical protein